MGFDWTLWRTNERPTVMKWLHLFLAIVKGVMALIVMGCYLWFWWTKYNGLNSTAFLFLVDLIPTTILVTTALPWNYIPPMPTIVMGFLWSAVTLIYAILFMIFYGDAAWDTDNIYRNSTIDDIANNARTPMIIVWFWALPVMIMCFMMMVFWGTYFAVYLIGFNPIVKAGRTFKGLFMSTPVKALFSGSSGVLSAVANSA